jgi:hypothetical protein
LVYYEPQTSFDDGFRDSVLMTDGFLMPFKATLLPLQLDPEKMIPPLLRRVREICDLPKPPNGVDGCEDCEKIKELTGLAG